MKDDVYHRLARQLDAIPHGFPATASGVEMRLLAKIFAPEEAQLAAVMQLSQEPAATIAIRAGIDPGTAYQTLKRMARKGEIRAGRKSGQLAFGLMPFVVGFYEEQLPRMDRELAELFEQYFQEAQGAITHYAPAVHRVLPIEETIDACFEVYPYERATVLLEQAKAWGVRDCICRVQQKLIGRGCERPVQNCLNFAPVEGFFGGSGTTRAITKEEALQILREAADAGLVHSPGNYRDGHYYICNCCTCCCGVLRSAVEFGAPNAIAQSDFAATVDIDMCDGCGNCLVRCPFGALSLTDHAGGLCLVDAGLCIGCGLCAATCPIGALHLQRRAEGTIPPLPADRLDWMAQRAQARGLSEML